MDYIFSTSVPPRPSAGRSVDTTPRSDLATNNCNHATTVEFSNDRLFPASSVSKHSSYHYAEDDSEDDIVFPEGENIPPLLKSLPTDDVDQLVAQELSKLSLGERQKALYDLHAVMNMEDLRPPSPEIQRSLLQEVQRIIRDELPYSEKDVYEQAVRMDASYVHDDKFVLKFLRNDAWDPARAAARLVKHFKAKLEFFPSDLLCRDITQDDLDPQTLAVLYGDIAHDLPLRDMAGRLITFIIPRPGYEVLSKVRRVFYGTMVKAEDEETQLKGRVIVVWLANKSHGMDPATAWKVAQVVQGLPMKHSAIHVCVPDGKTTFAHASVLALFGHALERLHVVRLKCHFGTPSELKSKLQAFGIPSSIVPVSDSGQILSQQANMMWNERRLEERLRRVDPNDRFLPKFISPPPEAGVQASIGNPRKPCQSDKIDGLITGKAFRRFSSPVVEQFVQTPSNRDVLLGRGRLCQQHVGNIMFRELIEERQKVFDILQTKGDKTRMAEDIVKHVKAELGGRFLQAKGFGWIEVPDKVARTKVATCFRTMRCIRRKDQEVNA